MKHWKEWIGCDFDGTLCVYDKWRGPTHAGAPIPKMVKRIQKLIAEGKTVKIFTARVGKLENDTDESVEEARKFVSDWTLKHIGTRLEVTNIKDQGMTLLYDDRAIQVLKNTGRIVVVKDKQ